MCDGGALHLDAVALRGGDGGGLCFASAHEAVARGDGAAQVLLRLGACVVATEQRGIGIGSRGGKSLGVGGRIASEGGVDVAVGAQRFLGEVDEEIGAANSSSSGADSAMRAVSVSR